MNPSLRHLLPQLLVVHLVDIGANPIDGKVPYARWSQQVWADAVFIKNFMALEQLSNEQLQKYALILHDLYQSYDIVLRALIELDRRNNTKYDQLYGEQILR